MQEGVDDTYVRTTLAKFAYYVQANEACTADNRHWFR
jgi:hypothetical protein